MASKRCFLSLCKVCLIPYSFYCYSGSTSHVLDIDNPDLIQFPLFAKAHKIECILKEGEILFIPGISQSYDNHEAYWFHNVLTMDPCIAVNIFWKHMTDEFYYSKDLYGNRVPSFFANELLSGPSGCHEGS